MMSEMIASLKECALHFLLLDRPFDILTSCCFEYLANEVAKGFSFQMLLSRIER